MVRTKRRFLLVGLMLSTLLLGGCVYLRLLQLKLQLGDFEKNFELQLDNGLTLVFKNPVLLDDDVASFLHWVPETKRTVGTAEQWEFRWVKDRAAADGDRPPIEFSLDLLFSNHKLVRLHAPETFFAATLPKTLAVAALRSLGGAKVDKTNRKAESTIGSSDLAAAATEKFLTQEGIQQALGAPNTIAGTEMKPEWLYRFGPASTKQRFGDSGVVEMTFTLDAETKNVLVMNGKTVFGRIVFNTQNVGPGATGTMNTALPTGKK